MIVKSGIKLFGFFKGLPYGDNICIESFSEYETYENNVDRASVINHFNSIPPAITSVPTFDILSGERFTAGLYDDGDFTFTTDFVRYYKNGQIGLPKEYEDYLVRMNIAN